MWLRVGSSREGLRATEAGAQAWVGGLGGRGGPGPGAEIGGLGRFSEGRAGGLGFAGILHS